MQTSALNLVRAVVMLGCLVTIPLIAVFGTSLPGDLIEFLDKHLAAQPASADESLPPAPPFVLRGEATPAGVSRTHLAAEVRPQNDVPERTNGHADSLGPSPIRPACFTPGSEPSLQPASYRPSTSGKLVPVVRDRSDAVPTSHRFPSNPGTLELVPEPDPSASGAALPEIEERLKALGATYYRLELWGEEHQTYRFHCRMAINGNPNFTRYFEATDPDPAQAMRGVLAQVETWQAQP
jgi:hypothetical protein